jgi:flagellar biosynthetic protein FlhB
MADNKDSAEKTEEPTQKKRDDARAEGKIATSTESFVLATLMLATLILMLGRGLLPDLAGAWGSGLMIDNPATLDSQMIAALRRGVWWMLAAGVGLGSVMIVAILSAQAGVGGLNIAPKALGFKPAKINPAAGLKRMVSATAAVNLGKAVLKVALLLSVAGFILWPFLPSVTMAAQMAPGDALILFGTILLRVLPGLLAALALIAALDIAWQWHSTTKSLRMSIQDIKDERKEAEGSPEVKGQQRRRQIEASQRAAERKALADVPHATAIITNPQHFAVALRYDPADGKAPVIIAMGKGPIAAEIRRIARRSGRRVLPLPPLARALYFNGAIGREIPEVLFAAVAVVLAHVWRLDQGQQDPLPAIDLPQTMRLDAFGRPEKGK